MNRRLARVDINHSCLEHFLKTPKGTKIIMVKQDHYVKHTSFFVESPELPLVQSTDAPPVRTYTVKNSATNGIWDDIEDSFKTRLKNELDELNGKRTKLNDFIEGHTFVGLSPGQKQLMKRQLGSMEEYAYILYKRLAEMHDTDTNS